MKDFLKKLIKAKEKRANEIKELVKKSENVDEVRSLGEELEAVNAELTEARNKLAELEASENSDPSNADQRDDIPANAQLVNAHVNGSFNLNSRENEDPFATLEYRNAFMAYVQNGTAIPAEFRNGEVEKSQKTVKEHYNLEPYSNIIFSFRLLPLVS